MSNIPCSTLATGGRERRLATTVQVEVQLVWRNQRYHEHHDQIRVPQRAALCQFIGSKQQRKPQSNKARGARTELEEFNSARGVQQSSRSSTVLNLHPSSSSALKTRTRREAPASSPRTHHAHPSPSAHFSWQLHANAQKKGTVSITVSSVLGLISWSITPASPTLRLSTGDFLLCHGRHFAGPS